MRKAMALLALLAGLLVAGGGVLAGASFAALNVRGAGTAGLQGSVLAGSLLILGLIYGLSLAWAGWRAYHDAPAHPFHLPGWGWLLLATLTTIGLGQLALRSTGAAQGLLPLIHVAAAVLPGLAILSLAAAGAARYDATVPRRSIVAGYAWGGAAATLIAITLQLVVVLTVAVAAGVWLQMTNSEVLDALGAWARDQAGRQTPDLEPLMPWLRSPLVLLGAVGFVSGVAPVVEEFAKTLIVPLVAWHRRRLTRLEAFLLGVAAGAGFAAFEGVFYGLVGLATPAAWGVLMLTRGSTAAIHGLSSGLAGLGWQAIVVERRWLSGLLWFALGPLLHGLWNAAAAGQGIVALSQGASAGANIASAALMALLAAFMVVVWLAAMVGLPMLARHAAFHSQTTPLPVQSE
jgi:hypothetical protein